MSKACSGAWKACRTAKSPRSAKPRAALLAFAVSVLAYNVLALVARCIERAHGPAPAVSFFHLTVQIRSGYEGGRSQRLQNAKHGGVASGEAAAREWLAAREAELLFVGYFRP